MVNVQCTLSLQLCPHLAALDAFRGEFFFIAFCTIYIVLLGDEWLSSYRILAGATDKTLFVPLPSLVLHLLHSRLKDVPAPVTSGRKLCVIARTAVNTVSLNIRDNWRVGTWHTTNLRAKLFVHQTAPTFVAQKAGLVPVLLFVGQIFRVNADDFPALITSVGKNVFVTFYAIRMVISQDIPL